MLRQKESTSCSVSFAVQVHLQEMADQVIPLGDKTVCHGDHMVGPALEPLTVLEGNAEQLPDHQDGEPHAQVVGQVLAPLHDHPVQQFVGDLADARLMIRTLVPWALAGLAGYFFPRWFTLREEWQRVVLAAVAGALTGWLALQV